MTSDVTVMGFVTTTVLSLSVLLVVSKPPVRDWSEVLGLGVPTGPVAPEVVGE